VEDLAKRLEVVVVEPLEVTQFLALLPQQGVVEAALNPQQHSMAVLEEEKVGVLEEAQGLQVKELMVVFRQMETHTQPLVVVVQTK
jgi:hypothetical protein